MIDIPMTTMKPACIPPYQTEVGQHLESDKNWISPSRVVLVSISEKRMIVSSLSTGIVTYSLPDVSLKNLKDKILKYKDVLLSFNNLDDDWDGYGSLPPSNVVIHKPNQILS